MGERICKRCGQTISDYWADIKSTMALSKLPKEQHVKYLVEKDNISEKDASDWLMHALYTECEERKAFCPYCNGMLRSYFAKQCPHCLKDWHDPNNVKQLGTS